MAFAVLSVALLPSGNLDVTDTVSSSSPSLLGRLRSNAVRNARLPARACRRKYASA